MHIHITLVGGQLIPIYKGILFSKPEKIILIHSEESRSDAVLIKDIIQKDEKAKVMFKLVLVNANNYENIFDTISTLIQPDNNYSFNITSGNKLMALAAYENAMKADADVYYIDQTDLYTNLKTKENDTINQFVSIEKIFELSKNPIAKSKNVQISNETLGNIQKIKKAYLYYIGEITRLLEQFRKHQTLNKDFSAKKQREGLS